MYSNNRGVRYFFIYNVITSAAMLGTCVIELVQDVFCNTLFLLTACVIVDVLNSVSKAFLDIFVV